MIHGGWSTGAQDVVPDWEGKGGQVKLVHQPPHCDIAWKEDGVTCSYSSKFPPQLLKPGSILLPLTDSGRNLYIGSPEQKHNHFHVRDDQHLYFAGDVSHGGVTYEHEPGNTQCYPALHVHVHSSFWDHSKDNSLFQDLDDYPWHLATQWTRMSDKQNKAIRTIREGTSLLHSMDRQIATTNKDVLDAFADLYV